MHQIIIYSASCFSPLCSANAAVNCYKDVNIVEITFTDPVNIRLQHNVQKFIFPWRHLGGSPPETPPGFYMCILCYHWNINVISCESRIWLNSCIASPVKVNSICSLNQMARRNWGFCYGKLLRVSKYFVFGFLGLYESEVSVGISNWDAAGKKFNFIYVTTRF